VSKPFEENTYIARRGQRDDCLVVDPGLEPGKVIEFLERASLAPAAILITHGHSDHIGGNHALKDRWPECPIVIGQDDAPKLTDSVKNLSAPFGLSITSPKPDQLVAEGDSYSAAGFDLSVLETPGHSIGHVVFVWKSASPWVVFAGDVLFQGSIGRTDFPDGSFEQLAGAIHTKLFTMPDDTIILPGHGPPTTIGDEKRLNPYVGRPAGFDPSATG
jgi:glyoxylase-like metal-dependent hydrolase (beta-lactamase superfamily II)